MSATPAINDIGKSAADPHQSKGNLRIAFICAAVVFGMTSLAYAAVPLYRIFCQITDRINTVRKVALSYTFYPLQNGSS